jgi:V/A-type H+-transporting ATPase subunit D
MAHRSVAPTKTNLLKLKSELEFAGLGYDLLDQKRNILINELLALVDQAVDYQEKVDASLKEAYAGFQSAALDMGKRRTVSLASAVNISSQITIRERKVMGVSLPQVETAYTEHPPHYSPHGTSFWVDISIVRFKAALELMGHLAELKVSIMRLAAEVKKTIRKVNALEKIAIPELKETVDYIQNRLEENERDMIILMKMVKNRLEEKKRNR